MASRLEASENLDGMSNQVKLETGRRFCPARPFYEAGNSLITFATEAHGPIDGGSFSNLVLPFFADLGEIVGPDVGSAAAVGAMDDHDITAGQIDALVGTGEGRVVPLGDLA